MKKLFSTILLMIPLSLSAQTASVKECQQWARENYPLIHRYDLIRQTEKFTLKNIVKGWLPQIGVSAQGSYQSAVPKYPELLSNMLSQMGAEMKGISPLQYRAAIDLQQTIYDGGSIGAQREVARVNGKVQEASVDVQIYALRERVNDLCFAILLLDQRLQLNEEMQRALEANRNRLVSMLEGGIAMQCDVDAMNAELATARQQHTDIAAQRSAVVKVLSLFTGKDVTKVSCPLITGESSGEVIHPELRLFDSKLQLIDAKVRALRTSLFPRIGVFAQGYYGYLGMNMFRDMMQRTPTLNGIIGIKASWNISAFYTHKNDRAKLNIESQVIGNEREVFLFNQRLQTSQEDSNIIRYQQLISEDEAICQLRRNVREASEAKLEAGIIDVNALILEISRENQANINKAIHEIELLRHQYKLQTIKGYETK